MNSILFMIKNQVTRILIDILLNFISGYSSF
jgi:hypothetical protein